MRIIYSNFLKHKYLEKIVFTNLKYLYLFLYLIRIYNFVVFVFFMVKPPVVLFEFNFLKKWYKKSFKLLFGQSTKIILSINFQLLFKKILFIVKLSIYQHFLDFFWTWFEQKKIQIRVLLCSVSCACIIKFFCLFSNNCRKI